MEGTISDVNTAWRLKEKTTSILVLRVGHEKRRIYEVALTNSKAFSA
jgi:hypothetical protein